MGNTGVDQGMRILTEALTFDDVSLVPAYSNVLPRDVEKPDWELELAAGARMR